MKSFWRKVYDATGRATAIKFGQRDDVEWRARRDTIHALLDERKIDFFPVDKLAIVRDILETKTEHMDAELGAKVSLMFVEAGTWEGGTGTNHNSYGEHGGDGRGGS